MTFTNNSAFSAGALVLMSSELHLESHTILTFINNTAISFGGAIFSYSSQFSIEYATNYFFKKSAANGGAMALLSSTLKLVNGNSNLTFENNSAKEKGGAIYVDPDKFEYTSQVRYNSFYNLHDTNCLYSTNPTNSEQYFYFIDNVAQIAGDDVYGASLEWCNRSIVHIRPKNNSSLSSISGNPSRVCHMKKYWDIYHLVALTGRCDDEHKPLCRNISHNHYSFSYHPGETIAVSVVVVGGDWGATHGMVYARFQPSYTSSILKPSSQYNQWINDSRCTSLNYTVYSNQSVQLVSAVSICVY
jgi:predicted outer membrane repeat protein